MYLSQRYIHIVLFAFILVVLALVSCKVNVASCFVEVRIWRVMKIN